MWKLLAVCLIGTIAGATAQGGGWGWGESQSQQQPNGGASAGNYWWMSSNPFQKPQNHPGIRRTDGPGATSYNQPSGSADYQRQPNSGYGQQSGFQSGPPASVSPPTYGGGQEPPVHQQPQPAPQGPTYNQPPSNGGGWSAPAQPTYGSSGPVEFTDCQLTNKADCHSGRPDPQPPQVIEYQPVAVPVVPVVPAPVPTYNQPPAPAPVPTYNQPPPPAPAPVPTYNQPPPPAPVPLPTYNQPPRAPTTPYNPPRPAPPPPQPYNPPQPVQQPAKPWTPPEQNNNNYQRPPQQGWNGNNNAVDNGPPPPPYPGCPAAMLCVPDNQCNAIGVISEKPLQFSEADKLYRVALTQCSNPESGTVGVCCRDPNYKDPWPDMNGGGGGDHHHHHDKGQKGQQQHHQQQQQQYNPQPAVQQPQYQPQPSYQQNQPRPSTNYNQQSYQVTDVNSNIPSASPNVDPQASNCEPEEVCIAEDYCVDGFQVEDDTPLLEVKIRSQGQQTAKKCTNASGLGNTVCCKASTAPKIRLNYSPPTINFKEAEQPASNPVVLPESQQTTYGSSALQPPQVPSASGQSFVFLPNAQVLPSTDSRIEQTPLSIIIPKPEQIKSGERIRLTLNSNVGASPHSVSGTAIQFGNPVSIQQQQTVSKTVITEVAPPVKRPSTSINFPLPVPASENPQTKNEVPASRVVITNVPLTDQKIAVNLSPPTIQEPESVHSDEPIMSIVSVREELAPPRLPLPIQHATRPVGPATTTEADLEDFDFASFFLDLDKNAPYSVPTPKSPTTEKTTTAKPKILHDNIHDDFTAPPPQPYTQESGAVSSTEGLQASKVLPITITSTQSSVDLMSTFGTRRKVEYGITETGEKIRIPSQYFELPSLTPEDFLKIIAPSGGANGRRDGVKNDAGVQFFSPLAKASPAAPVDICPGNMKCLTENLCAQPDPREGASDDFDIRTQMKKRLRCKQPNLPTTGYCCYLRDDYADVLGTSDSDSEIGFRKNQKTCGVRRPNGGARSDINTTTSFGEFPWQALILRNSRPTCGGAILDKRTIITTASCVQGIAVEDLRIKVGEWDTRSTEEIKPHQELTAKIVYVHPGFKVVKTTPVHDIALIVIEQKLKFDFHISPVCLPDAVARFEDQRCIATGWFVSHASGAKPAPDQSQLSKVHIPILPYRQCEQKLRNSRIDLQSTHRSSLCAGGDSTVQKCMDHSGGPLVCEDEYTGAYTLAGIMNWSSCGDKTSPGLYTSIPAHMEWIASIRVKEREDQTKSS